MQEIHSRKNLTSGTKILDIYSGKDYSPGTCRYRIGNYRIFYEISNNDRIVHIIGISIRQAAY